MLDGPIILGKYLTYNSFIGHEVDLQLGNAGGQMPSLEIKALPHPPNGKAGWPWTKESRHLSPTMRDGIPWPKISIVTPSYNQGRFLEETIRSVLLQNYPNLEYIIMDGGSTDNSVEIIKRYESWLTYWVSEKDNGQTNAINKGFSTSTGEILTWLNSDDILLANALGTAVRHFEKPKCYDLIIGERLTLDSEGYPRSRGTLTAFPVTRFQVLYMGRWPFYQESMLFTRKVWQEAGPLSEEYDLLFDFEFFLKCLNYGKAKPLTGIILGAWRRHSAQKICKKRQEEIDRELKTILSLNRSRFVPHFLLKILSGIGRRTVRRNDLTLPVDRSFLTKFRGEGQSTEASSWYQGRVGDVL
jgi:glycosyltransferase involved in cell wall biosynthesis